MYADVMLNGGSDGRNLADAGFGWLLPGLGVDMV